MLKSSSKKTLVNVLGVVYVHTKSSDGGDFYLTPFADPFQSHLNIRNWYERSWFDRHKIRLLGTSSVFRVPTRKVRGRSIDLVVKNCRVGEDVPINTHTLQEFCDAEFNSPWEEFALVMEMREGQRRDSSVKTQRPLAIYVPPEKMQLWQSGRSRARINRIRARHPGIDIDILKQYKLIYEWIRGKNLMEVFDLVDMEESELVHHLKTITQQVHRDMNGKGYLMADMKPEHIIIEEEEMKRIEEMARSDGKRARRPMVDLLYELVGEGRYSVIDYELLFRTPEHEEKVKSLRRHSYLDDQRNRFTLTSMPSHLSLVEIFGVPYVYGHAESTKGHLWVVGKNARLFDYFLPERWRKTPSISLSDTTEVFYTVTKDNIRLVWKTSRVGELPQRKGDENAESSIRERGINSPFEEFAIAHELNSLGIRTVYVRAIYMTGGVKVEPSSDPRKYEAHKHILDAEGNPILQKKHNYITIRGYYNGPDEWVPDHQGMLYTPIDLSQAARKGYITEAKGRKLLKKVVSRLRKVGYDGSLLNEGDLLLIVDGEGNVVMDESGEPDVIICDFELIWKIREADGTQAASPIADKKRLRAR